MYFTIGYNIHTQREREREDERCSHCKSVKSYLNESNRKLSYVILVNARMEMGNDLNVEKRRERVCVCGKYTEN